MKKDPIDSVSQTSDDRFFIRAQWFLWGFVAGLWVAYFLIP